MVSAVASGSLEFDAEMQPFSVEHEPSPHVHSRFPAIQPTAISDAEQKKDEGFCLFSRGHTCS